MFANMFFKTLPLFYNYGTMWLQLSCCGMSCLAIALMVRDPLTRVSTSTSDVRCELYDMI